MLRSTDARCNLLSCMPPFHSVRMRRCVGWYHSHPHFEAQPCIIDIRNQVMQQRQARTGGDEPYIGAIVGPYDEALAGNASHLTWFHVQHEPRAPARGRQAPLPPAAGPWRCRCAAVPRVSCACKYTHWLLCRCYLGCPFGCPCASCKSLLRWTRWTP